MFTMVNTHNLKRIQVPQEEIRIERRNSEMEIHCVKPQILPHLNKVPNFTTLKYNFIKRRLLYAQRIQSSLKNYKEKLCAK